MKNLIGMAAVVFAVTMMVGGGGIAFAGEMAAPAPGTWEFQAALETGALPTEPANIQTGPRKLGVGDVGLTDLRYYMGHPYTEGFRGVSSVTPSEIRIGGTAYRVGVDTP
ncbi:MAG: hypothetical protein HZA60_02330 [Deltaproteobacteria bacterium]|nr:hypothetical protein [Deltaproteobacteria bacterium]